MSRKSAVFVFVGLIIVTALTIIRPWKEKTTDAELKDMFLKTALGVEEYFNPNTADEDIYIVKWVDTLRVRVFGVEDQDVSYFREHNDYLYEFGKVLKEVGISFEAEEGDDWNFGYFFYSNRDGFSELRSYFEDANQNGEFSLMLNAMDMLAAQDGFERGMGCFFFIQFHNNIQNKETLGKMIRAYLVMPTFADEELSKACFFEESIQALGIPNDYVYVEPPVETLFDDQTFVTFPTDTDIKLLKILYDPLIKPGMSREEVLAVWLKIEAANQ